jgi:hypothetical protein
VSRRFLGATFVLLALTASATALAGNGYRLYDAAWHRPPSGSLFSVNVHGIAAQKALVYLYLDRKPCRTSWASEARLNLTPFKAGQSYFRNSGDSLIRLWVSGRFNTSFTARAASTAEPEYACAYLTTPNSQGNFRITAAHRSNAYFVTTSTRG